ncbi:PilZ domain-containing protein [Sphingobium aquiterrae]|uniref:PilZ domain-containing protein n=1 Tax=Sphingobium aquiterrae TaxID=2038656 RepID=UPI0030196C74
MEHGIDGPADRGPARAFARDSLFLLTDISSPEGIDLGKARVRNLSATGLMADSESPFRVGQAVCVELRGLGRVSGTIAWTRNERIGIAFDHAIDPQQARKPVSQNRGETALPAYLRVPQLGRRL